MEETVSILSNGEQGEKPQVSICEMFLYGQIPIISSELPTWEPWM